jgi:hypothetical protein
MTANSQEQALIELYKISHQLVTLDEINSLEILQRIAESARKALNADMITLYTYEQERQKFGEPFVVGDSLFAKTIRANKGIFIPTVPSEKFVVRELIKSAAALPLRFGKEPVGVMFVSYRTPQAFTEEQRELIELFANQAAIAVMNVRFIQALDQRLRAQPLPPQGEKVQFYSCFISHSSKDEGFARKLYTDLQAHNVRCWFAPVDMRIGDRIRLRIHEMIRQYDKLLLILSKRSVASQWVEQEVEAAMEKEREKKRTVLFPIRLDDTIITIKSGWAKDLRNTRHIGDFSNWQDTEFYTKSFRTLLNDLTVQ